MHVRWLGAVTRTERQVPGNWHVRADQEGIQLRRQQPLHGGSVRSVSRGELLPHPSIRLPRNFGGGRSSWNGSNAGSHGSDSAQVLDVSPKEHQGLQREGGAFGSRPEQRYRERVLVERWDEVRAGGRRPTGLQLRRIHSAGPEPVRFRGSSQLRSECRGWQQPQVQPHGRRCNVRLRRCAGDEPADRWQ